MGSPVAAPAASPVRVALFLAWPRFDAAEVGFWHDLSAALDGSGLRLVLASTSTPPATLRVPHIRAVPGIDTWWPEPAPDRRLRLDHIGLDAARLLDREAAWGAPAVVPAVDASRLMAMEAIAGHWLHLVALLDPAVIVLWNGQHVSEMILDAVARDAGIPVLYVERAPIPGALFADEHGLSAASAIARRRHWPAVDAAWRRRASTTAAALAAGTATWWEQPPSRQADARALRDDLGIPAGARVVLFAGQVDEDTQQFLFAPHFPDNVSAFAWLLAHLPHRHDVYVLGKHHPKSRTDAAAYRAVLEASGVPGAWRVDLALEDAFAVSDRVAAVNSTVLYEALARGLPVLSLGHWLLEGRGAAYEMGHPQSGGAAVEAWWHALDLHDRRDAWLDALGYLLSTCIYTYNGDGRRGLHGATALAARIASLGRAHAACRLPVAAWDDWLAAQRDSLPPWRTADDATLPGLDADWQHAHGLRHQILTAAGAARCRRVVVWGTGRAGRLTRQLLVSAGVRSVVCASSAPASTAGDEPAVLGLHDLATTPRDLVVVATVAAADIVPQLEARGFAIDRDILTIDCDVLARCCQGW